MKDKTLLGISLGVAILNFTLLSFVAASSPETVTRHFHSGIQLDDETLPGYIRIMLLSAIFEQTSKLTKSAFDEQTAGALAPKQDENCAFETAVVGIPKLTADGFAGNLKYFYRVSGKQIDIAMVVRGKCEAVVPSAANPGGIRIRSLFLEEQK